MRFNNLKKKFGQFRRISFALTLLFVFFGGWLYGVKSQVKSSFFRNPFGPAQLTKVELRDKIQALQNDNLYSFKQNEITIDGYDEPVILDYAFDPSLQAMAEDLIDQYRPDVGAMVAVDASTGRVLAMTGRDRLFGIKGNLEIGNTYPSASVFKVVTAAAAIEERKLNPHSMIPYAGRDHTLYKYQMRERVSGWVRKSSLKDAFARSINTVFGRLGVFHLGKEPLKNFSNRFGFNEAVPSEFPVEMSKTADPANAYELAEMASGFTQHNVITPLHGAMMAAAIANDGVMMQPYFLNAAYLKSGKPIYRSEPEIWSTVMTPETAYEVRTLMKETVTKGTSQRSFRGFFRGKYSELEVGGKTGHLTDKRYGGQIDWFVGFAQAHGRKIAVSVLTLHDKYWRVKSSYLARRAFENAFKPKKKVAVR